MEKFKIGDHWRTTSGRLVRVEAIFNDKEDRESLRHMTCNTIGEVSPPRLYDANGICGVWAYDLTKKETDSRKILKEYLARRKEWMI